MHTKSHWLHRLIPEGLTRRASLAKLLERHPGMEVGPHSGRSSGPKGYLRLLDRKPRSDSWRWCSGRELPRPEINVRFGSDEVDFFWRSAGLTVEVVGYAWHPRYRRSSSFDSSSIAA